MVDNFLKHDFVAILAEVCPPRTRREQGLVDAPELPHLKRVVSLSERATRESLCWGDFEALGSTVSPERLAEVESRQRWDDPILLQYTSGTTARPKGALCDHRYVLYASVERLVRAGLGPNDSFLNTQPFYHVGGSGILTVPLVIGCRVVCAEYYEVERIFALIERNACTVRSGHAAMYTMELNHPALRDYRLDSLRAGWCIGPPALMQQVRDKMGIPALVQIYGMSEGGGAGGHWQDPWEIRSTTCGRALTGLEMAIRDADSGRDLPPGQVGEICTRGWLRMRGYLKQPEETAKAIDAEGWLHSGDLGVVDQAGYLRFVGRVKDMLRIGGVNVSAEEVESVLLSHPGVAQAAVIGAPDDRLTEVVMAVIEPRGGTPSTEADVISFCKERMANFRVPKYVRFVESWPLTGSGKIQKNTLRDIYLAGN